MKKKPSLTGALSKEHKQSVLDSYQKYLQLSSYLFKKGDNVIYNMNEMSADSPFVEDAKRLANEMKINWEKMTHANSNRIMLALLEEYFQNMQQIDESSIIVETKLIFVKDVTKSCA